MAPKERGKNFIQDKGRLLELAETITSRNEVVIRQKIDRTKAAGASLDEPWRRSKRAKSGSASAKLRAAKETVAARKISHKREKIKARKKHEKKSNGAATTSSRSKDMPEPTSGKRVSFA